jgi:predicted PurR-regulated permease PerM
MSSNEQPEIHSHSHRTPATLNMRHLSAPKVLVIGALGVLLYVAHFAFIPIALALLFALVLSSPVEGLHKRGVPRGLGALVLLAIALSILIAAGALMWKPAQYWYQEAPQTIRAIKHKFAPAVRIVARVDDLGTSATTLSGSAPHPTNAAAPAAPAATAAGPASTLLGSSLGAAISSLTFVILTLFLLTGGPPMMARMTAAFVDDLNASRVLTIISAVRAEVGRFYATTTIINFGLGITTTVAMLLLGMPTPYVWGIVAALLNFIPYAGATATLAIVTFVASMTFSDIPHILGVAGTYLVIATIEGQVVQPLFVGRRLEINPLLIFLGLWLGGLFWGVAGILLATPCLVALKVIAQHSPGGKAVLEFLGPNNEARNTAQPRFRMWTDGTVSVEEILTTKVKT